MKEVPSSSRSHATSGLEKVQRSIESSSRRTSERTSWALDRIEAKMSRSTSLKVPKLQAVVASAVALNLCTPSLAASAKYLNTAWS
eukprot:CAMPEP_0195019780 /NCGR_PEP_ID=MMETSP0326_2-20130528/33640_1 /TAXON_ID=2866 ORGANISM="Crypthecodinium cohnii, Strain Seligo" /NCGR_SAMPLE_ID=MMETSP0326_2 /ASSEMBLY_ACC=CAM_ASM_000348 /LENGTH=85 /DNA_ID=CAMNT_0040038021 /DNA_START=366 /DNA_END=624 /DNA_ORIENTATION=+